MLQFPELEAFTGCCRCETAGTQTYSLYFKCTPTKQMRYPVKAYESGGAIRLKNRLAGFREGVAVAFSGGVDSTYLAIAAGGFCPGATTPFLMASCLLSRMDRLWTECLARDLGLPLETVVWYPLEIPEIRENGPDRCYHCKRAMYSRLVEICRRRNLVHVFDGTQEDDLRLLRPGLRAVMELGIRTPLLEANLGKNEIRRESRRLGLPTWNRPSQSCLGTRIACGIPLTAELLASVEDVEGFCQAIGVWPVRFRVVGEGRATLHCTSRHRGLVRQRRSVIIERTERHGFRQFSLDPTPLTVR